MGTSGDRKGFKIFSINTTVRNPKRNTDFLRYFKPYDGKLFTESLSYRYFFDLVSNGVYRFTDISESVKFKIENGIQLDEQEAIDAIKDNPQATGLHGRVMTQLRSMKDQGFLMFEPIKRGLNKIYITPLGYELIDANVDATLTYTKAMIGMHAHSPIRSTMLNESRPFLNTLFVICEVKKAWKELGYEAKGILQHEFSVFVLSMKDCNYKSAANDIIEYRKKFRYRINMPYILDYLNARDILPLAQNSLLKDYPDDVFRKFEMTGLIVKRGAFGNTYYDYSSYNIEKIESILTEYANYSFHQFSTQRDYYNYIDDITIPWQKSEIVRRKIVESKAKILGIKINPSYTLTQQEELLDKFFYNKTLESTIDKYDYKLINKELLILSGTVKEKSKFDDISEPLRLEYLLALLIGKRYGTKGLVSNIIYGEDGSPLHFAPAGKCDIIFHHEDGSFIFEPTMQRGKNQILNNETANVARHVKEETQDTGIEYRAMMIAPYVHPDVASFFQFKASKDNVKIAPLNIDRVVGLVFDSEKVKDLGNNFDGIVADLLQLTENEYADKINQFLVEDGSYV